MKLETVILIFGIIGFLLSALIAELLFDGADIKRTISLICGYFGFWFVIKLNKLTLKK